MSRRPPLKPGHTRIVTQGPDGRCELTEVPIDSDAYRNAVGLPRLTPPPTPANLSMSFTEALSFKRAYGADAVLPPDMAQFTLPELEARADEEQRPAREQREAEESAARIDAARHSITRALLSGPPRRRTPSRIRACFLRQLERWGTISQAAAAVGVDPRTIQRWRNANPAFDHRCLAALAARRQTLEDDAMISARTPRKRQFFFGGKKVGETSTFNDRMLLKMLAHMNANDARAQHAKAPTLDPAAFAAALGPVLAREMRVAVQGAVRREMSEGPRHAESDAEAA